MNTLLALLVVLFSIADPASDAIGDGTLTPPTAPLYASSAMFDIRELTLYGTDDGELTVVLEMAALERDDDYVNDFRSLIADIYIDTGPGGENALLTPGEWLLEPTEAWNYLVRVTPDGTYGLFPGENLTDAVSLSTELYETQIIVTLPRGLRVAPEHEPYAYALAGLYDPFAAQLWRAVETVRSPWSFSSDSTLPTPVLDVTAPDFDIQASAFQNRVMPKEHVTVSRSLIWVVVMLAGLLVAIVGWVLRLQKRPATAVVETSDAEEEPAAAAPARKLELLAPVRPTAAEEPVGDEESVGEDEASEPGPDEESDADTETEESGAESDSEKSDEAPTEEPDEDSAKEQAETVDEPTPADDNDDDEIVIPFVERRA